MKASKENTAPYFFKAWKLLGLAVLFILVSQIGYAQNTKGAEVNDSGKPKRENRFRIPFKKNKQKGKSSSFNRVQGKGSSLANSARKTPSSKPRKVYSQKGPYVHNSSTSNRNNQKAWKGSASGSRLKVRSNTGKTRNVYPQYGRYVNNPSRTPKKKESKVVSNHSTVARINRLQRSHTKSASGSGRQTVVPRSASHSFMARKSINVYANFARPKPKKEKAHIKDITGRRLRTKNFETPKPKILTPTFKPYSGRSFAGDKSYHGRASGSYRSASRSSERAWKGNISGNKIRGRNYSSKPRVEGHPISPDKNRRPRGKDRVYRGAIPGSGYRSATQPGEARTGKRPLPVRTPRPGAARAGTYHGSIKRFNLSPGFGNQGEGYSGAKKARKPIKGGGSISGKYWNNGQRALPMRNPSKNALRSVKYQGSMKRLGQSTPGFGDQGEGFTGYKKAKRPVTGGGSISGRVWNNSGKPINVRIPEQGARAATFQGNIKTQRPTKGGGSISGRVWNNSGKPINVRIPEQGARAATFQGNIKTQRPEKGGGSISGRVWNNKQKPLPVRTPPPSAQRAGTYQGNIKRFEQSPTFMDQGEEFTGFIKLRKFKKNYVQNPNAADASIMKKYPNKSTYSVDGLQVRVKERDYVQNKNSFKESLLKKKPSKSTYLVDGLQVKVKQREYGKKPNAAEGSMLGIKPSKSSVKASEYARGVKRTWNYIHNPSSADEAMKTREPGKAFGRSTDYQGNIKMQKFHLFEKNRHLHPDATFVKTNKNNVDGERDLLTNVKLWWAKLFKKQDTQPDNLKDKGKRPRYDKREDGLWNE